MLLLALSIAPGIAISLYIFLKDRFNREPHLNLLVCFFLGCLSVIPAIIIQLLTTKPVERFMGEGIFYTAVFAYLIVGLSEEWSKYIMLRSYAFPKKSFDEPFDGIVYSVMVGMGFATVENIGYVMQHGMGTAILRMFLSVPAHATFAIIMGYYAGKAKFKPPEAPQTWPKQPEIESVPAVEIVGDHNAAHLNVGVVTLMEEVFKGMDLKEQ